MGIALPLPSTLQADILRLAAALVTEPFSPAHVVVNEHGEVLHYSTRTGKYLEPAAGAPKPGRVRRESGCNRSSKAFGALSSPAERSRRRRTWAAITGGNVQPPRLWP